MLQCSEWICIKMYFYLSLVSEQQEHSSVGDADWVPATALLLPPVMDIGVTHEEVRPHLWKCNIYVKSDNLFNMIKFSDDFKEVIVDCI